MTSFKKSFVKPFARPSESYTVEDSYWKKLTVSKKQQKVVSSNIIYNETYLLYCMLCVTLNIDIKIVFLVLKFIS